jgi:hypothetical protein
MMNTTKILQFVLIGLACLSCRKEDEEALSPIKISTEQGPFAISEDIHVEYLADNVDSLFITHCNFAIFSSVIQKKENSTWKDYNFKICLAIYQSGLLMLQSNQRYYETVRINEAGEYRIVLYYYNGLHEMEEQQVESNSFLVE